MSNHQWSGRTILDPNDAHQLEQDAATYEFKHRMPREDAEHRAYHEYQQKKHREAAAYHLKGIRASQAVGDGEEGRKHGAMYQLHMQALGLNPMDAVPGDIKSMAETAPEKFYRFKAHKGDLYALQKAHLLTGYASLKKAWPVDAEENNQNLMGFASGTPHSNVARDAMMEGMPNIKEHTGHVPIKAPPGMERRGGSPEFGLMPRGQAGRELVREIGAENADRNDEEQLLATGYPSQTDLPAAGRYSAGFKPVSVKDPVLANELGTVARANDLAYWGDTNKLAEAATRDPKHVQNPGLPSKEAMLSAWQRSPVLKFKKNWPDLQTEHGQQAFANTVSQPVLVDSVPHGTPIKHSVQSIGNLGLQDAATANEVADTIDEDIPGAIEPSHNPVFQAGNPSDRMNERDYWQMVQASPILKRKGLKKAWPKDNEENAENALGFASGTPHKDVARDAFLEHATNTRNHVKEYKRKPVIKVPEGMWRAPHGAIRTSDPHFEGVYDAMRQNAAAHDVPMAISNREPGDWLDTSDKDIDGAGPFWDMNVPHEQAYGHNPNFDPNVPVPSKEEMQAVWQRSPVLKRKK